MFHVKHRASRQNSPNHENLAAVAAGLLESIGLSVDRSELDHCCKYLLAILALNETTNLTAIRDPIDAVRLHVVDSLTALPEVLSSAQGPLCDIGSGGG